MGKNNINSQAKQLSPKAKVMMTILAFIIAMTIIFVVIYGVIQLVGWRENRVIAKIKSGNTKTIGTIIKIGSMKGSYVVAQYYVNGIEYTRQEGTPSGNIYTGEHYEVFYMKDDPQESRIDFTVPVFLKEQATDSTTGTVFYKDFAKVGFSYSVNGREIKRWQRYKKELEIRTGDTYQVQYLISNPAIGILKLKGL